MIFSENYLVIEMNLHKCECKARMKRPKKHHRTCSFLHISYNEMCHAHHVDVALPCCVFFIPALLLHFIYTCRFHPYH